MPRKEVINRFQKEVWHFYQTHRRDMPWRPPSLKLRKDGDVRDPYKILVSEIMLQQTQVSRVIKKYQEFIQAFPDFETLASAPLSQILKVWQGMGYNRRALALQKIAKKIAGNFGGILPQNPEELVEFPGIGPGTAGAIAAFAWNYPSVFIETNIRRVFIHRFFREEQGISDDVIMPLVAQTLPRTRAREWYYALMDYGNYLAGRITNPNRQSRMHRPQPVFKGSRRELRGAILRELSLREYATARNLQRALKKDSRQLNACLEALMREGLIQKTRRQYALSS